MSLEYAKTFTPKALRIGLHKLYLVKFRVNMSFVATMLGKEVSTLFQLRSWWQKQCPRPLLFQSEKFCFTNNECNKIGSGTH